MFSSRDRSLSVKAAQEMSSAYRNPPDEILDIVLTPPEPLFSFSLDRKLILELRRPPINPPIAEFARPELKLAGEMRTMGGAPVRFAAVLP